MDIPLLGQTQEEELSNDGPKIRLLFCFQCKSLEEIPDFEGNPEYDDLLQIVIEKHKTLDTPHTGQLMRVPAALWTNPKYREEIAKQIYAKGAPGMEAIMPGYYDVKNQFAEDAMTCWKQHNRTLNCEDYGSEKKILRPDTKAERKDLGLSPVASGAGPSTYLCQFCLTGDTEVVTRTGIRAIRDLVGTSELLIPFRGKDGGISSRGSWKEVDVKFFGVQPTFEVALVKAGRRKKTVTTTAEHRWLLRDGGETTTESLQKGQGLKSLKAVALRGGSHSGVTEVPFAVAQGFVFGDGSAGHGDSRPATLALHGQKDSAMLPYFSTCRISDDEMNGRQIKLVRHLPRSWKDLPPIDESRSFLVSWLAGYFAADGTVSADGSSSISSASKEHIRFVRDVAAVCGIGYGKIVSRMREGFEGREPSALYTISLTSSDLPEWFWIVPDHSARAARYEGQRRTDWIVESVTPTGRVEPVYCAVVPDVEAFGLADDLMTGNCPVHAKVVTKKREKAGMYK